MQRSADPVLDLARQVSTRLLSHIVDAAFCLRSHGIHCSGRIDQGVAYLPYIPCNDGIPPGERDVDLQMGRP